MLKIYEIKAKKILTKIPGAVKLKNPIKIYFKHTGSLKFV